MTASVSPPERPAGLDTLRSHPFQLLRGGLGRGPSRAASSQRREYMAGLLRRHGIDTRIVSFDGVELAPDQVLWISGNAGWHPQLERALRSAPAARRPFVVAWHSEPLPHPAASGLRMQPLHLREIAKIVLRDDRATDPYSNLRALRRLSRERLVSLIAVSSSAARETLAERGVEAEFVPLGLNPFDGRDLGLERDVDVLLVGTMDVPRRRRIVRALRRRGVQVSAVGGWGDPRYWGEPRTELLNRTRILLNVPRHKGLLSGQTMLLGMANKALVVAEPIYRPEPYRPDVHYVSASVDEMPEAIERFLSDGAARARITEAAYRFVHDELTLERSTRRILELVAQRVAGQRP